jgi:hypothetical protein
VATSTSMAPLANRPSARSRGGGDKPPCSSPALKPSLRRFRARRSAPRWVRTKINVSPRSAASSRTSALVFCGCSTAMKRCVAWLMFGPGSPVSCRHRVAFARRPTFHRASRTDRLVGAASRGSGHVRQEAQVAWSSRRTAGATVERSSFRAARSSSRPGSRSRYPRMPAACGPIPAQMTPPAVVHAGDRAEPPRHLARAGCGWRRISPVGSSARADARRAALGACVLPGPVRGDSAILRRRRHGV